MGAFLNKFISPLIGLASLRSILAPGSGVLDSGVRNIMMRALTNCNPAAINKGTRGPNFAPRIPPIGKAKIKAPPAFW